MAPTSFLKKYGHFATHDSGIPHSSGDYITLVVIHGLAWHSGVFYRLLPLAQKLNARLILVNRRDYPGSDALSEEEVRRLSTIGDSTAEASTILQEYMRHRAREVYDFLGVLIRTESIPLSGGLIVAGWSSGAAWITALLSYSAEFPVGDVDIGAYVRRAVLYDPPYHTLGYPPPAKFYNPLSEPSLPPGEGVKLFPSWVSGYYSHGNSASELEHRTTFSDPRPSIETMSKEDIESALYPPPANPGGSDNVLMEKGILHGLYSALRRDALYLPGRSSSSDKSASSWDSVVLRLVWCDRSVWEMPWGAWALHSELDVAKLSDRHTRQVQFVRLDGANHFAHWDQPERALRALLSEEVKSTHL